jgi:hypothetical protein
VAAGPDVPGAGLAAADGAGTDVPGAGREPVACRVALTLAG